MELIYPVNKNTVKPHIGHPVCAILQDGTNVQGILGGFKEEQVILQSPFNPGSSFSPKKSKPKKTKRTKTSSDSPASKTHGILLPADWLAQLIIIPADDPSIFL